MALAAAKRIVPIQAVQQAVQRRPQQEGYVKHESQETNTSSGSSHGVDPQREDNSSLAHTNAYSALEAALQAWMDFQPDGYTISEDLVPSILDKLAQRASGKSSASAGAVRELFSPELDETAQKPARFLRMLTSHNGIIHFLYFWSAFSEALRYCSTGLDEPRKGDEMLLSEFEILRDGVLVTLGNMPGASEMNIADLRFPSDKLAEVLQVVASRSCSRRFWSTAAKAFAGMEEVAMLTLDDLTVVIMCWHRDAMTWHRDRPATNTSASSKSECREAAQGKEQSISRVEEASKDREAFKPGLPVYVHIYDVSQEDSVKKFNKYMASRYSPIKFGGIFHAGVEVNGLEWSYGVSYTDTVPGISCIEPRTHPAHSYRQTVQLRPTKMNAEEIADLISNLIEEYPGDDYCLLRRNCCHFADDFSRRLGAGRIPGWIHRLARLGARVDGALQLIGRQLPMMSAGDSSSDEEGY